MYRNLNKRRFNGRFHNGGIVPSVHSRQVGNGLFSILRSAGRAILPFAKRVFSTATEVGKNILEHPTTKKIAETGKELAIETAIDASHAALKGENVDDVIKNKIEEAKESISKGLQKYKEESIKETPLTMQKKKKKKKRKPKHKAQKEEEPLEKQSRQQNQHGGGVETVKSNIGGTTKKKNTKKKPDLFDN